MPKQKKRTLIIAALLLFAFAAAKLLLLDYWQNLHPQGAAAECNLIQGCTLPDGTYVRATPIRSREPFDIRIQNAPRDTQAVSVSFSMKNMDMGFNRYDFAPIGGGIWQARQIRLPVCVEGRRDYLADITIGNQTFQTAFSAE